MVNNVARTNKTLNTNLGQTTSFTSSDTITILTGEVGVGLLIFDSSGTLGVITQLTNTTTFTVTTYAKSIDVTTILNLSY